MSTGGLNQPEWSPCTYLRHSANVEPDKVTQEEHPAERGGGGREDAEVEEEAAGDQA